MKTGRLARRVARAQGGLWLGVLASAALQLCSRPALAFDYEVHRLINQLALASLPTNCPGFLRTPEAAERIAFLSGEPDRWRNVRDLGLSHSSGPEHYLDVEQLEAYGRKAETLPPFRYVFVGELALARQAHA